MTSTADRPLVLVVEDDPDTRDMYAMFLDLEGFAVMTAATADSAFDIAVAHQPRVVVTDLLLPGGPTGADLCRRLHDDWRTAHIPALLLTGSSRDRDVAGALEAGCAAIRIKPHLPESLLSDIREMIGRGERHLG